MESAVQTDPSLFDLPPRMRVYLPGPAPPPIRVEVPTPITWEAVHSFLEHQGFCAQEVSKARTELLFELQARLTYRTASNVYQSPACVIPLFGRRHAAAFFRGLPRTVDTVPVVTWEIYDPDQLTSLLHPFSDAHAMCVGQSKAMGGTKLNPFVSVIATLFQLVASSVCKGGRDLLYLNGLYVLMNDKGEIDYPKNKERRPIAMCYEDELRLREVMQRDLTSMAEAEICLSSAFLRMLGEEWAERAAQVQELEREQLAAAAEKTAALTAEASAPEPAEETTPRSDALEADEPSAVELAAAATRAAAVRTQSQVSSRASRAQQNALNPRWNRTASS